MNRNVSYIIVFFCGFFGLHKNTKAQVIPASNDLLNYTEIMFEYPPVEGAVKYHLKIAEANISDFNDSLLIDTVHLSPAVRLHDQISFGRKYKWKYEALSSGGKIIHSSAVYLFSIISADKNKTIYRWNMELNRNFGSYAGQLLFFSSLKKAHPVIGEPRLYMVSENANDELTGIRFTSAGTLTFIRGHDAIETDLRGNILWQAPDDGQVSSGRRENYHSAFLRQSDGNYLVCGKKQIRLNEGSGELSLGKEKATRDPNILNSETIIEYDKNKTVVWRFVLIEEIKKQFDADLNKAAGTKNIGQLNGLAVSKDNRFVYASFAGFYNVVKIEKQTNKVVYIWGNKEMRPGEKILPSALFEKPSSPSLTKKGTLLLFNNAAENESVIELDETFEGGNEKLWEYKFDKATQSSSPGYIMEAPSGNIMAGKGNMLMEITRKNEIIWSGFTETISDPSDKTEKGIPVENGHVYIAASLYPCWFTAEVSTEGKVISREKLKSFPVTLNNEGTEKDTYLIELMQEKTNLFSERKQVEAGNSTVVNIKADQVKKINSKIPVVLKLTSTTSGKAKEYTIRIKE